MARAAKVSCSISCCRGQCVAYETRDDGNPSGVNCCELWVWAGTADYTYAADSSGRGYQCGIKSAAELPSPLVESEIEHRVIL